MKPLPARATADRTFCARPDTAEFCTTERATTGLGRGSRSKILHPIKIIPVVLVTVGVPIIAMLSHLVE